MEKVVLISMNAEMVRVAAIRDAPTSLVLTNVLAEGDSPCFPIPAAVQISTSVWTTMGDATRGV